jgi:PKD repeat protein
VNAIIKRVWNYGDGIVDSLSAAPYQHQYTKAGEYTISLKVVDSYGCADIITKKSAVVITQPKADFVSPDSLSCINKPIRFTNKSSGYNLVYEWSLGDGTISRSTNPTHNYKATGLYTTALVVTDKYGCKDSVKKVDYINISYPSAAFSVSDSFATCPPLLVNFTNSSADYTSMNWTFDDGNASAKANPSHYYTMPGVYHAKLVVSGPGGCKDSVSKKIEVRGPIGTLDYEKQTGCSPLTVTLKAHTMNSSSFVWDYSDGTTLSTKDAIVKHTYTRAGSYVPKMILTDATGCSVPIAGKDTIKVVEVVAKFGVDNRLFCDSGSVKFRDSSVSNEAIKSWQWSFGNGKSSSEQHPENKYTTAGSFLATLIATTQTGCKDTAIIEKKVEVYQGPAVTIAGNLESCVPAKLGFRGDVIRGK